MPSFLLYAATAVSGASAAFQGFNYGSSLSSGAAKQQSDFETEFKTAAGLDGTNGAFTSARLFTMIQANTPNTPIAAIPAAINTKTSLLFGLWASSGQDAFNNELAALKSTISQYCSQLDGLVAGISVGSEDLYRASPLGVSRSEGNPGATADTIVSYIGQVRDTVKGSCLSNVPVGHVDTYDVYTDGANKNVIDVCDFLGVDAYPYFETNKTNNVENGAALFRGDISDVQAVAGGKPIWITESGWPVSGPQENLAVPGTAQAQLYWKQAGCPLFGNTNVWWYTLQDSSTAPQPSSSGPSFGVVGSTLSTKPLYDLSCSGSSNSSNGNGSGNGSQVPSQSSASSPSPSGAVPVNAGSSPVPAGATLATPAGAAPVPASTAPVTGGNGKVGSPAGSNNSTVIVPTGAGSRFNALMGAAAGVVMVAAAL